MDQFVIQGPTRLAGRISAEGAKNAALPAMAASLLTEEPVVLGNLPPVRDIRTMRRLLEHLGAEGREDNNDLELRAAGDASADDAPYELVKTMRASVLVLGPLLARRGNARVSLPGGCAIGVRPIDQHLKGLAALGAEVDLERGYVNARCDRLRGARFRFEVPSVTGTENLLMAATLARGSTTLENCAREPEIRDLAELLTSMGAHIDGAGESVISVEGVSHLEGADHAVLPDRIEGGTYLIAAAISGGDITLEACRPTDLEPLTQKLQEIGCTVEASRDSVRVRADDELRSQDVVTTPHPGFPTDLQAQYMALMTQATGAATIEERVFENRFQHVPELNRMGASIQVEGSSAHVSGPTPLTGASVMATDLRASACLVLAGVAASGTTAVSRIYHLDRGYVEMETKLRALGGQVRRISKSNGEENDQP